MSGDQAHEGDDQRQGVSEAGHAVLDRVDETRESLACVDLEGLLDMAAKSAAANRGGGPLARRSRAITAAAFLIIAIERLDQEIAP